MHYYSNILNESIMKRVVKIFILILTAQLTVINVFSQTKQNSFCDTIFVSVDDLTRYTDFLEITTTKDSTLFGLSHYQPNSEDWKYEEIHDIEKDTMKYIHDAIFDFYYYKTKKKYKYYRHLKHVYHQDPGPGGITVRIEKANGSTEMLWMYFTDDIMSTKPSCNGHEMIIYSDEYKKFIGMLLELTYKYTGRRRGPWHEISPGFYGWHGWE